MKFKEIEADIIKFEFVTVDSRGNHLLNRPLKLSLISTKKHTAYISSNCDIDTLIDTLIKFKARHGLGDL